MARGLRRGSIVPEGPSRRHRLILPACRQPDDAKVAHCAFVVGIGGGGFGAEGMTRPEKARSTSDRRLDRQLDTA